MEQSYGPDENASSGEPGQGQTGSHGAAGDFTARIRQGMEVVSSEGSHVGTVAGIEGDEILLTPEGSDEGSQQFVPLSLIEGIDGERVLMRARGDNVFGEEATH
jgi:hypothetical protein